MSESMPDFNCPIHGKVQGIDIWGPVFCEVCFLEAVGPKPSELSDG